MEKCEHDLKNMNNTLELINTNNFINTIVNKYECKICNERFLEQVGTLENPNYYWIGNEKTELLKPFNKKIRKALRISLIKWNFNLILTDLMDFENIAFDVSRIKWLNKNIHYKGNIGYYLLHKRCGFCKTFRCQKCPLVKENICDDIMVFNYEKIQEIKECCIEVLKFLMNFKF